MRYWKRVMSIVFAAALLGCVGCSGEEGWQNGVSDGVSAAVSAAISTPITAWVENTFK